MEFEFKAVTEEIYNDTLVKWWGDWNWTAPPFDILPDTGFIISKGDADICAGFIYFTNSKIAWLEYIVSNKKYVDKDRKDALLLLINTLSLFAKDNGFNYIYASLKNESLINKYAKCGFIKGDTNCTEMIKIWQQQPQQL